jgi:hypothetical protein
MISDTDLLEWLCRNLHDCWPLRNELTPDQFRAEIDEAITREAQDKHRARQARFPDIETKS